MLNDIIFLEAAEKNELARVRTQILEGQDVNATDAYRNTAVMLASMNGHVGVARFLIAHKADLSATDEYGNTALMLASQNGHDEVAKTLIEKGANVHASNNCDCTALMHASVNGNVEIARALIHKGANVDVGDEDGDTAFIWAARKGKTEIANMLFDLGAEIDKSKLKNNDLIAKFTEERIKERDENLLNKHERLILDGESLAPCNDCASRIKLKALSSIRENKMEDIKKNPEEFKKIKNSGYYTLLQLQENEKPKNSDSWIKAIFKNPQEFKDFYKKAFDFEIATYQKADSEPASSQASSDHQPQAQDQVFSIPEIKNKILESFLGENLKRDLQNLGEDSTLKFIDKISVIASEAVKPSASSSASSSSKLLDQPSRGIERVN